MKNKKKMTWWQKLLLIIGSSIGGIVALAMTFIMVINVIKFPIYADYYSIREIVCTNHGLNDNYISQGTAITNDGKYLITSGYMSDDTNSRIYITEVETDKTHIVKLESLDGKPSTYHFGGVAITGDNIYLASSSTVFTLSFSEALENETMKIKEFMKVSTRASYIFTNEDYMYVGEYYDPGKYETDHKIEFDNVTYNAIVEKFDLDSKNRLEVYAVRDNVQGFAVNEQGDIVLSKSFGLTSSEFFYYTNENITKTNTNFLDVPLYILANHNFKVSGPSMSEDLDYNNGKFYTNYESASNKYIFGKFVISSDKIVALDFSKFVK